MIPVEVFRAGTSGVPTSSPHDLPEICRSCAYLITEEFTVCFCDAPFYYYCAYNRSATSLKSLPPCFADKP